MPDFAEATKENGVHKGRVASVGEEEEDDFYLMKQKNDHLYSEEESFAAPKRMQEITHKIWPKDRNMI